VFGWLCALERAAVRTRDVVADRAHDVGPLEDSRDVLVGAAVAYVGIPEDVGQVATTLVLADEVDDDPLLRPSRREQEREGIAQESGQALHYGDCILAPCDRSRRRRGTRSGCWRESTTTAPRSASSSGSSAGRTAAGRSAGRSIRSSGRAARPAPTTTCSRATSSTMRSSGRTRCWRTTCRCS